MLWFYSRNEMKSKWKSLFQIEKLKNEFNYLILPVKFFVLFDDKVLLGSKRVENDDFSASASADFDMSDGICIDRLNSIYLCQGKN